MSATPINNNDNKDKSDEENRKKMDTFTAEKTLQFLGKTRLTQLFILKGAVNKKKLFEKLEQDTRKSINSLSMRIRLEVQNNPELLKNFNIQDCDEV